MRLVRFIIHLMITPFFIIVVILPHLIVKINE